MQPYPAYRIWLLRGVSSPGSGFKLWELLGSLKIMKTPAALCWEDSLRLVVGAYWIKLLHSQRYLLLLLQMFLLSQQLSGSKGSGAFVARSRPEHPLGRGGEPSLKDVLWSMLALGEKPEDICAGWLRVLTRTAELGPQRYLRLYANKKTLSFFILGPRHST